MTLYSERLIFDALREAKTLSDEECKALSFRVLRDIKLANQPRERQPRGGMAAKISQIRGYLVAWMEYHRGKGVAEITLARFHQLMDDLERLAAECKEDQNVSQHEQAHH